MSAVARLLEYAVGRQVALPAHTTLEVLEAPHAVPVPGAASHALGLMAWQGGWLPLVDLGVLLHGQAACIDPRYALVVAWQGAPGESVQRGAIALHSLPQSTQVKDDEVCDLPGDSPLWPALAPACFQRDGQAVPILDTGRVFRPN